MAEFRGVDHVDMRVRSLAAVRAFYDRLLPMLGLVKKRYVFVRGDNWDYVTESEPHNTIEYHEDAERAAARFVGIIEDGEQRAALTRIAFAIAAPANFEELERYLVSLGACKIERSEDEASYPAIFFEDAVGTRLELRAR